MKQPEDPGETQQHVADVAGLLSVRRQLGPGWRWILRRTRSKFARRVNSGVVIEGASGDLAELDATIRASRRVTDAELDAAERAANPEPPPTTPER